jgi:hypothetical protein
MATVSDVDVAVFAATAMLPEAPVNTTVLPAAVELKPDPANVNVAPTAARVGDTEVNVSVAGGPGTVNVFPGPAATVDKIRRVLKKTSMV